ERSCCKRIRAVVGEESRARALASIGEAWDRRPARIQTRCIDQGIHDPDSVTLADVSVLKRYSTFPIVDPFNVGKLGVDADVRKTAVLTDCLLLNGTDVGKG